MPGGILGNLAIPVAMVGMLAVGAVVGLGNGIAVSKLRMPPFIVTLTSMMFVSGLAVWSTRSRNIGNLPESFNHVGSSWVFALGLAALLGLGVHAGLSRTVWGGWLYAIGHNRRAAFISGVPVASVTISAYMASGILSAAASILYTGQAESGSPVLGQRLLLDVIGGVVIGGTSLFGGRGKVVWTLCGVLFLKLLDNSLNLLDLSYFVIMMVKGAVILLAAVIDTARTAAFREMTSRSPHAAVGLQILLWGAGSQGHQLLRAGGTGAGFGGGKRRWKIDPNECDWR